MARKYTWTSLGLKEGEHREAKIRKIVLGIPIDWSMSRPQSILYQFYKHITEDRTFLVAQADVLCERFDPEHIEVDWKTDVEAKAVLKQFLHHCKTVDSFHTYPAREVAAFLTGDPESFGLHTGDTTESEPDIPKHKEADDLVDVPRPRFHIRLGEVRTVTDESIWSLFHWWKGPRSTPRDMSRRKAAMRYIMATVPGILPGHGLLNSRQVGLLIAGFERLGDRSLLREDYRAHRNDGFWIDLFNILEHDAPLPPTIGPYEVSEFSLKRKL